MGEKTSSSSRDSEDARAAQDRKSSLKSRVDSTEQEARAQLRSLQPMIQEHHTGWQRLLAQQKKLDSNQHALTERLEESNRAAELEASVRAELESRIDELVASFQGTQAWLRQIDGRAPSAVSNGAHHVPAPAPQQPSAASAGIFDDEEDFQ